MKNHMKFLGAAAAAILTAVTIQSCDTADELPPIDEGYATRVVMPDPVDLTAEDRAYIEELQNEYDAATSAASAATSASAGAK